jgi:hypothetical protein
MRVGELIRVREEWTWLCSEFEGKVGIVTRVILLHHPRVQFLMGGSYYILQLDMVELVNK